MPRLHRQDVLLAVRLLNHEQEWTFRSLGESIGISASQCHSAFGRLVRASIVDESQRVPVRANLLEFLQHAVKYLFPVEPGAIVRGIPTAHSAPVWKGRMAAPANPKFVWEHPGGRAKGNGIEPLYRTVPEIALRDRSVYAILATVDSIRVGKARERNEASAILRDLIYGEL